MNVDYQVIKRYLEGQEREGDQTLIIEWFSDLKVEKDLQAKYKQFWSELPRNQEATGYSSALVLARINQRIRLEGSNQLKDT